jgi:hypothetical protein
MLKPPPKRLVIPALALALGLGGCANTAALRDLAAQTSTKVDAHHGQMNDFIAAQRELNASGAQELMDFAADTGTSQTQTGRITEGWRLAGRKDLLDQQAVTSQVTSAAILTSLVPAPISAADLSDGGSGKTLDEASKTYALMAKPPTLTDNIVEALTAADAVYQAVETIKAQAGAEGEAKAATAKTAATK